MRMMVDDLLAEANDRLDQLETSLPNTGRVARRIDLRTFRHYRSLGLVDPPLTKQGTAGVYGKRHADQLVAIKNLQAQWVPLREIRRTLAQASDEKLTSIAGGTGVPARRSTRQHRTDQATRHWVELRLGDDAFAMVSPDLLGTARPSALRAIGERFVAQLLAERGRQHA